jgi:hypothetical protein
MTPQQLFKAWAVKQVPPHTGSRYSSTKTSHDGEYLFMAVEIEQVCDQTDHSFNDRDHEPESDVSTLSAKIYEYSIFYKGEYIELTEDEISEIEREIVERGN